jgi:HAAS domain-containing protein
MTTTHPLANDYVKRLDRAAHVLPRRDREDLVAEIRTHLDSGLPPDATEADVRNLLDELGPPENIVAAAAGPQPATPTRGAREVFALILLVTGLPPVIGWLAGVGLLLWSPLWSTRQKLLGILVWPGGYPVLFGLPVMGSAISCPEPTGGPSNTPTGCVSSGPSVWWIIAAVIIAAAPLVVATYLYRAAGRQAQAA